MLPPVFNTIGALNYTDADPVIGSMFSGVSFFGLALLGVCLYIFSVVVFRQQGSLIRPWYLIPTVICYMVMYFIFAGNEDIALLLLGLITTILITIWGLVEISRLGTT